jgi:signal transduction histidine kinase
VSRFPYRILVADDEEVCSSLVTRLLSEKLGEQGLAVEVESADRVETAKEALLHGVREARPFDVVVLDWRFSEDVNGVTLMTWMNREALDTEVILLTGYPEPHLQERVLGLGAYFYADKADVLRPRDGSHAVGEGNLSPQAFIYLIKNCIERVRVRREQREALIASLQERQSLETARARLQGRLDLLRMIAHDVKDPLSKQVLTLDNALNCLAEGRYDDVSHKVEDYRKRHEVILRNVTNVINLCRSEAENVDRVARIEIHPLLIEAVDEVAQDFSRCQVEVPPDEAGRGVWTHANPTSLKLVFKILIKNAAESVAHLDNGTIRVACRIEAGLVVVSVEDNGPGVPVENRSRIFEFGFGTKGSTGLGLPTARSVLQFQFGESGKLEMDPSYEPGSRFVIEFPPCT